MASSIEIIVHSLRTSQRMLTRFAEDLKGDEYMHRTCSTANCAAWILGHLILTDRRLLGRFAVSALPELPDGFEPRFARDQTAAMAGEFGDVNVLLPLFNQHRDHLIDTVKAASSEKLDAPLDAPHPLFRNLGEAANFMSVHTSMHTGQITMIRRSLGRPPLV